MPTINQTIQKLEGFTKLAEGWHYGEGGPIGSGVKRKAETFLLEADALGFDRANVFPGIDGGVEITLHYKDLTAAFIWESDGSITFVKDSGGNILTDEEGLTQLDALLRLSEFSQETQISSESFIYSSGTKKRTDLKALHLSPPIKLWIRDKESPFLKHRASIIQKLLYANISQHITQQSLVTLSYSGASMEKIYPVLTSFPKIAIQGIDVTAI